MRNAAAILIRQGLVNDVRNRVRTNNDTCNAPSPEASAVAVAVVATVVVAVAVVCIGLASREEKDSGGRKNGGHDGS
jgi:hypothetical protein